MKLFAALREESQQGWVWICDKNIPARSIVKITNLSNGNVIYCEALQIDENFINIYNQSPRIKIKNPNDSIVINSWYRAALGNPLSQSDAALVIKSSNNLWGKFKACTDHPQVSVRLTTWISTISLLLGIFGFALGLLSVQSQNS
ncbi:MAG: hypothetical protein E6Q87_06245 [Cellvibrionales bacterium]|nr:MAG: hypothetical protein E6Q87_06245 [Cellvibrionales bacterium]